MEPEVHRNAQGLAPIAKWSVSSPLSSSPLSLKKDDCHVPDSPKSVGSSGIGRESLSHPSPSSDSLPYSPALSSVGDEPPPLLSTSPAMSDSPKTSDHKGSARSLPNLDEMMQDSPLLKKNGAPPSFRHSPEKDEEINVRFIGQDGNVLPIDDNDSIMSSKRNSDDEEESSDDEKKPKVPDGGWGWVVVFSSLIISMIADGISFSFGLMYIEFLDHFGESKSVTSWIGSLFMAVPLLSGPIGSALVDRYGCRMMTMIGGLISGLGFVLAAFSNTIFQMYMTFGVIAGLGLGLCYVTAVVSIAYWFDKKRTLATGLGACGTGIGTFVYSPMTTYFIQTFGWRGTTLMLAGTFFNMCVCGALMRDPEWWTIEQNKTNLQRGSKSLKGTSSCGSLSGRSALDSDFVGVEELRKMLKSGQTPEYMLAHLNTSTGAAPLTELGEKMIDGEVGPSFHSVVNLPTFVRQSEKVPLEVLESLSSNKHVFNVILENYPSLLLCRSSSDNCNINKVPAEGQPQTRVPVTMSMRIKQAKKLGPAAEKTGATDAGTVVPLLAATEKVAAIKSPTKPGIVKQNSTQDSTQAWLRRQFSMNTNAPHNHYLKNIRVHRNSVMYRGAMLNIHKYRLRASSCPDIYRNSMTTIARESEELAKIKSYYALRTWWEAQSYLPCFPAGCTTANDENTMTYGEKWYEHFLEPFRGIVDFSMFLELHFLLMSLSTILLFTWFIVPYFYLADFIEDINDSTLNYSKEDTSLLLSIIGITNTIGMIGLGWAGDQPWMNVTKTYAVCLAMCGLSTAAMAIFIRTYWALVTSCALFGIFFASTFSFTPVILVQLIPLERFTLAYGLILLCQGIGNLLGPPIAGWLFDVTRSWDLSFHMAALWIVVSGVLCWIIPITRNRRIIGNAVLEKDRESIA